MLITLKLLLMGERDLACWFHQNVYRVKMVNTDHIWMHWAILVLHVSLTVTRSIAHSGNSDKLQNKTVQIGKIELYIILWK